MTGATFVGRTVALQELSRTLEAVAGGTGALLLISGEAGVGKTRLLEHFVSGHPEVVFLRGKCLPGEGVELYHPFVEAIGATEGESPSGPAPDLPLGLGGGERVSYSLPMGLAGLGAIRPSPAVAPLATGSSAARVDFTQEKSRMFESVAGFVSGRAKDGPVVFLVDDLQWADDATLQLLHYLVRNTRSGRVLWVGAYRPEDLEVPEESPPLVDFIKRARREGLLRTLEVSRLEEQECARLLSSLLGRDDVPWELVHKIFTQTEGNPYFLEEVVKSLAEQGILDPSAQRLTVDLSSAEVPTTVKDVIGRRVEQLPEDALKVLQQAAVVGPEFTYDVLLASSGVEEETLVEALDSLADAKLIVEDRAGRETYRFTHNMIQEVAYAGLSRAKKRLMHKRVAKALEEVYAGRTETVVFALAHHYTEAADLPRGLPFAIAAGDRALSSFGFTEAVRYYTLALESIETLGGMEVEGFGHEAEVDLLIKLGYACDVTGDWKKSKEYYLEAIKLCDGDTIQRARAHRQLGHLERRRNEWESAREHFEAGLRASEALGDLHGMADTYSGMAWIAWRTGDFDQTVAYSDKCIAVAEQINDRRTTAQAKIDLGNAYNELAADLDRALEYYEEALALLEAIKDQSQMPRALNNIGDIYLKKGEYRRALEYFERTRQVADKNGDLAIKGYAICNLGETQFRMGDAEQGIEYIRQALEIFRRTDDKYMVGSCYMFIGIYHHRRKEWEQAERYFEDSLRLMQGQQLQWGLATTLHAYGLMLRDQGLAERAHKALENAAEVFERLGARPKAEEVRESMAELPT